MSWLRGALSELFGLFVDDAAVAIAVLAWLVVCGLGLPRGGVPADVTPLILFAGLAAIILLSTARQARDPR